ncbi:hypothetical protein AGLY_017687, partial [Aphis glycines]
MNSSGKGEESISTPVTGSTSSNDIGANGAAALQNVEPTLDTKQMLETLMVQNRIYNSLLNSSMFETNKSQEGRAVGNVSNNLKPKALDDPREKPSKILHRELREGDNDNLTTTDTMRIRKNIHYARSSIIPKLPKNLEDLHLALTNLALSTQTNLKYLTECDVLYVDGKTTEIYKNAFSNLINKICELNLTFTPRIIYADFEQAIHSAISEIFPEVLRKGCRFHLGQTMWRKIQSIGLSKYFEKKSEIGNYLKLFFGSSFLKPEEIQQCFSEDLMDIKPNNQQLHDFCNFFEKNYILESCKFPPSIWAEFSNSLMRTTNACESFHSKLNSIFYPSYPNIFQFLEVLKNVQTDVYIKMRSSNQTQIRRKAVEKEDYIREIMRQYEDKIITRLEFIEKLAYKNLPSKKKGNPKEAYTTLIS